MASVAQLYIIPIPVYPPDEGLVQIWRRGSLTEPKEPRRLPFPVTYYRTDADRLAAQKKKGTWPSTSSITDTTSGHTSRSKASHTPRRKGSRRKRSHRKGSRQKGSRRKGSRRKGSRRKGSRRKGSRRVGPPKESRSRREERETGEGGPGEETPPPLSEESWRSGTYTSDSDYSAEEEA